MTRGIGIAGIGVGAYIYVLPAIFKMTFRTLLMTGIFSFLFGCKDKPQNAVTETFQVDGDTITTKSTVSDNSLDANYQLADLTPELKMHIAEKLRQADSLIHKYNGYSTSATYDANLLDEVFEKWRQSKAGGKETPEFVVEALGAAFGQDIVNSLDCEWQVLTGQYGHDLTVIHKKYKVNGFPFSTAEKAYTENKIGSFQTIKLTFKHEIERAKKGSEVQERH